MDPQSIKRWCVLNIILPGLSLIDNNGTTPPPTCHDAAYKPGIGELGFWTDTFWGALCITLIIIITVGSVLAIYLHRRRKKMRGLLEHGIISKEEYERLK